MYVLPSTQHDQFPIPCLGSVSQTSYQRLAQLKSVFPVLQRESQVFSFFLFVFPAFLAAEYLKNSCFLKTLLSPKATGSGPWWSKQQCFLEDVPPVGVSLFPWCTKRDFDCLPYSKYACCQIAILIISVSTCLKYYCLQWKCRMWTRCLSCTCMFLLPTQQTTSASKPSPVSPPFLFLDSSMGGTRKFSANFWLLLFSFNFTATSGRLVQALCVAQSFL